MSGLIETKLQELKNYKRNDLVKQNKTTFVWVSNQIRILKKRFTIESMDNTNIPILLQYTLITSRNIDISIKNNCRMCFIKCMKFKYKNYSIRKFLQKTMYLL